MNKEKNIKVIKFITFYKFLITVKHRTHILYEEARKPSTSPERRAELEKEMTELVKTLPRPKDIEKLKSRKGGVR